MENKGKLILIQFKAQEELVPTSDGDEQQKNKTVGTQEQAT